MSASKPYHSNVCASAAGEHSTIVQMTCFFPGLQGHSAVLMNENDASTSAVLQQY